MVIALDLALLTLRVLENRVGILTGDGCGDGLSMLKLLEVLSSGFDGVGLGKIGRWCGKLAASWHASAASGRNLKVGPLARIKYTCGPACPSTVEMQQITNTILVLIGTFPMGKWFRWQAKFPLQNT